MAKKYADGWHTICGHRVYVENNMVKRGISSDGQKTVYPYRPCKTGGWYCDQTMSVAAFRSAWYRDTVNLW